MLVWTGAHLLWRESALLRRRHFEDELDDEDYFDEELPEKVNA
ncbi:hypothetical protein [Arthrobacter alpinus]|nr:hypothetical protein [Arthrobacter alpinus]